MHEMAHMWFGDLVTMQWWDDLWLKESFADYMGTLGVDRATDWDTAWVNFANNRKAWAYVQDQLPTTHPIVADIPDLEAAKQNFDGITYAKGASVLKQLVAYVGFDAFIAGSRQYFRDHAYGNTTLADLLAALGAASGRDLRCGPASGCRPRASPPSPPKSTSTTACSAASPSSRTRRTPPPAARNCGRTACGSGSTTLTPTARWSAADSVETDLAGGTDRRAGAGGQAARRRCCWSTTRTSATRRSGSIPRSEATVRASLDAHQRPDGPGALLDRPVGLSPGRRHAGVPLR